MKRLFALAVLVASIATAQTVTDQYKVTAQPQNFTADMAFDQRLRVNKVVRLDGGCVGCQTGIASGTWDFPVLGNNEGDTPCAESATLAVPGALIGDGCSPSTNLGADGGARLLSTATLSCTSVNGGAYFQLCVKFTDGGSYNLGDAGVTARIYR